MPSESIRSGEFQKTFLAFVLNFFIACMLGHMMDQTLFTFKGYPTYITLVNSNLAQRLMQSNVVLTKFSRTVVFNSAYFTKRICSMLPGMKSNVFFKQIQIVIEGIAFDTTETKRDKCRTIIYCLSK